MSITDNIHYSQLLRGNLAKGATHLSNILSDPAMAADFITNVGGLAVVYGSAYSTMNTNDALLINAISTSKYKESAAINYLNLIGVTDRQTTAAIMADTASMQKISGNASAVAALMSMSREFLSTMVNNNTYLTNFMNNTNAMQASGIFERFIMRTSLAAAFKNSTAVTNWLANKQEKAVVWFGRTAVAEFFVDNDLWIPNILASAEIMNVIVRSASAMTIITNSSQRFGLLLNSANAMYYVVRRKESKRAILDTAVKILAVETSNAAIAAFTGAAKTYRANATSFTTSYFSEIDGWGNNTGASSQTWQAFELLRWYDGATVAVNAGNYSAAPNTIPMPLTHNSKANALVINRATNSVGANTMQVPDISGQAAGAKVYSLAVRVDEDLI